VSGRGWLSTLLLALSGAACAPVPGPALHLLDGTAPGSLNGALELRFDGPLQPSSVTPRSLRAWDGRGRLLDLDARVRGERLVLHVPVDEALLADPPRVVHLALAGDPSPHALGGRDGRRLAEPVELDLALPPHLADGGGPPTLTAVDGRPVSEAPRVLGPTLKLTFEGVLDPATLRPGAFPLVPLVEGGLALAPVAARLDWRIVGPVTEVTLTPPAGAGRLQLETRRLAVRGLDGEPVEPLVVLEWQGG
jgi:hypothetical protein